MCVCLGKLSSVSMSVIVGEYESEFESEYDIGGRCSICLKQLMDVECDVECDDISILKCGHRFHTTCISNWLSIVDSCPICRMKCNSLISVSSSSSSSSVTTSTSTSTSSSVTTSSNTPVGTSSSVSATSSSSPMSSPQVASSISFCPLSSSVSTVLSVCRCNTGNCQSKCDDNNSTSVVNKASNILLDKCVYISLTIIGDKKTVYLVVKIPKVDSKSKIPKVDSPEVCISNINDNINDNRPTILGCVTNSLSPPCEPKSGGYTICIKLPNNDKYNRRFNKTDRIGDLLNYIKMLPGTKHLNIRTLNFRNKNGSIACLNNSVYEVGLLDGSIIDLQRSV